MRYDTESWTATFLTKGSFEVRSIEGVDAQDVVYFATNQPRVHDRAVFRVPLLADGEPGLFHGMQCALLCVPTVMGTVMIGDVPMTVSPSLQVWLARSAPG